MPYLSDLKRRRKDDIYRQLARVGKALARSKGLEILELVSQSERSLEERAPETAMSAANTSRHVPALAFTQLGETIEEDVLLFTASRTCWFPISSDRCRRSAELPRNRTMVAYCRGPSFALAAEAVQLLSRHGFRAYRLEDGVADWRARGFSVDFSRYTIVEARHE
jgi:rhodanese-related sulfurtransferase